MHSGESIENTIYKKLDNVLILEDGPIKSKEINSIINNILSIEDPNIRISILNNVFNNDKQYSIIEYKLIASIYALEDTNLKNSILDSFNNNVIDISNYYGAGAIYILLNIGKQFGDINLENVDFSNPNNDLSKLGINALELLSWANENNNKLIGRKLNCLIEGISESGDMYVARSYMDVPDIDGVVFIKKDKIHQNGEFIDCIVKEAYEYDLIAEEI